MRRFESSRPSHSVQKGQGSALAFLSEETAHVGAQHALPRPGRPHARPQLRPLPAGSWPRWSGCTPAAAGPRGRCGSATAATCCGATFPTTASCAGTRRPARSACSASPSNNANGNTRDRQGRLVTCEHDARRVTRTEYDGSITVLCRPLRGQAAELAERRGGEIGRQHLVHRSAVRHPAATTRATRTTSELPPASTGIDPQTGARRRMVADDIPGPERAGLLARRKHALRRRLARRADAAIAGLRRGRRRRG